LTHTDLNKSSTPACQDQVAEVQSLKQFDLRFTFSSSNRRIMLPPLSIHDMVIIKKREEEEEAAAACMTMGTTFDKYCIRYAAECLRDASEIKLYILFHPSDNVGRGVINCFEARISIMDERTWPSSTRRIWTR
jgi:hypothetical protein